MQGFFQLFFDRLTHLLQPQIIGGLNLLHPFVRFVSVFSKILSKFCS